MIRLSLSPYDPQWAQRFEQHRARIAEALGERATRIDHIGSTSVPGLSAKPIIDIIVQGVTPDDDAARAALEQAGYHITVDEPGHRIYEPPALDVHIHLWSDPDDIERHVVFRDWLRSHPEDRTLYEHVKRQLVQRDWETSNHYAQAKTAVINTILRRARGQAAGPRIERFAQAVSRHVSPQSRILEIGAGEGLLAARLAAAGHDVVAIDEHLRSTFPIVESTFESYAAPAQSFDCVAAQLVLHHAQTLDAMLDKALCLLKIGAIIAIDDYGWERSDDPEFREQRADLHTSEAMLRALRDRFDELFYSDRAYFDEGAGDDSLGFTFIGKRR